MGPNQTTRTLGGLVRRDRGLIYQVKAQAQVEQLCSTLTLLLILIVNMTSNKLRTRWASTLPKQLRSFRHNKKLRTARITSQRQFKKHRKGQKSRLKRYHKLKLQNMSVKISKSLLNRKKLKVNFIAKAHMIWMVRPYNTQTSSRT